MYMYIILTVSIGCQFWEGIYSYFLSRLQNVNDVNVLTGQFVTGQFDADNLDNKNE